MIDLASMLSQPLYMSEQGVGLLQARVARVQQESSQPAARRTYMAEARQFLGQADADWFIDQPVLLDNGVLVMPLDGPLFQADLWRWPGMETLAAWYRQADADKRVKGVLEVTNSPGGQVFGAMELAETKVGISKPIVTRVTGLCTSAAQMQAGASNLTLASSPNCIFGSIGVKTSFTNASKFWQQQGIDIRDVYATTSPGKNYESREADKGNFKPMETGIIAQMDASFMAFMQQYRQSVTDYALKGYEFTTLEAVKHGLCDGIATFDEAVEAVLELTENSTKTPRKVSIIQKIRAAVGHPPAEAAGTQAEPVETTPTVATPVAVAEALPEAAAGTPAAGTPAEPVEAAPVAEATVTLPVSQVQALLDKAEAAEAAEKTAADAQAAAAANQQQIAALSERVAQLASRVPGATAQRAVPAATTESPAASDSDDPADQPTARDEFNAMMAAERRLEALARGEKP